MSFVNYHASPLTFLSPIVVLPLNISFITFDEFYLENTTFKSVPFTFVADIPAMIEIKNTYSIDALLGSQNSFFRLNGVNNFIFQNHTIVNSGSIDESDYSYFFEIFYIKIENSVTSLIQDISFMNSTNTLMTVNGILGETDSLKQLILNNVAYRN